MKNAMDHDTAVAHVENNDSTPQQVHAAVMAHPQSLEVHAHAAVHPNTSTNTLQHIYDNAHIHKDKEENADHEIRGMVASHPNAPAPIVKKHFEALAPEHYNTEDHHGLLFHDSITPEMRSKKVKEILAHADPHENPEYAKVKIPGTHNLTDDQLELLRDHLHDTSTADSEVHEYAKHKHPQVAAYAASARTESNDHVAAVMARKDVNAGHIKDVLDVDDINPSQHFMKAAYERFAKEKDSSENEYGQQPSDAVESILSHKDAPKEVLDEVISKKPKKNESFYHYESPRQLAFQNANTSAETVKKHIQKGDADAMKAALGRDDTDEESLRIMHSHKENLGYSATSNLLAHKNFPRDLTLQAIKDGSDAARFVLRRKELDPETLKVLLSHKNQKIAVEALNHKSITPELVLHAYNRKAGAVSRAAADHPLAPLDLKMEKALKDVDLARSVASKLDDKGSLETLFNAHKNDGEFLHALAANKNAPPSLINKAIKHADKIKDTLVNRWGHETRPRFYDHPNLDAEGRAYYLKTAPSAIADHPSLTSEEISGALADWASRGDRDSQRTRNEFVEAVMRHPNLSEKDAKDIVTGAHGTYSNDLSFIHNHPAYTKDVIDAGLKVGHELTSPRMVENLAESPHLTPDDIRSHFNKHSEVDALDRDQKNHSDSIIAGLLNNRNIPADVRARVLGGDDVVRKTDMLGNPSLTREELLKFATEPSSHFDRTEAGSKFLTSLTTALHSHKGALEEALQTTVHPNVARTLMMGPHSYSDWPDTELSIEALKNKNPEVIKGVLDTFAHAVRPRETRRGKMVTRALDPKLNPQIDSLADHPDKSVAEKAFQFMSPEAQKKVMGRTGGALSADIIPHLQEESIKNMAIGAGTSPDIAEAILQHPKSSLDHYLSAAGHADFQIANSAIREAVARRDSRWNQEDLDKILGKAHSKHPDEFANYITRHSADPKLLKNIMMRPEDFADNFHELASNTSVRPKDLEALTVFNKPEHAPAFQNLARHRKTPVQVLQHITENYPELMADVAAHPKAASSKVLKNIVKSTDVHAKANLVKNSKVPDGIKQELLKDKAVFLTAKPHDVDADLLEEYAGDKDLNLVKAALEHREADRKVVSRAIANAVKQNAENPQLADAIFRSAASKELYEKDKKILLNHSAHAARAIFASGKNQATAEDAANALDRYQGKDGYDEMARIIMARESLTSSSEVVDKLLNNINLDHVGEVRQMARRDSANGSMSYAVARMIDDGNVPDRHHKALLDKLASLRGPEFKYSDDNQGRMLEAGDAELMTSLLRDAPEDVIAPYADNKAFHSAIAQNPRLKGDLLTKIISGLQGGDEKNELSSEAIFSLSRNRNLTKDHQSALVNHALPILQKSPYDADANDVLKNLGKSHKLAPEIAKTILGTSPGHVIANPAISASDLQEFISSAKFKDEISNDGDSLENIAKNPNFRLQMVDGLEHLTGQAQRKIVSNVASNYRAHRDDLARIYNEHRNSLHTGTKDALIQNPGLDADTARKMLKDEYATAEEMEYNPAIGGELWRSNKKEFPEGTGVKSGLEIPEAHFRPREEKVKQVMSMIPQGGFIEWAQFKKENPKLAGDPIIQKMFTSAPKTRVDQAHADKYLQEMPSKKFLMSYRSWTGAQRHNNKPQTVFQINNSEQIDDQMKSNPELTSIYRVLQNASQASGHPHGPQHIGWSRVDTSHPDHWFVDEIQSDFNSSISRELNSINDTGHTKGLEQMGISPDRAPRVATQLVDMLNGWEKALLQNIIETAKKHGVKKISIQSGKSKTVANKGRESEVTNKYDKIYNRLPQELGFQSDRYDNLPHAGNDLSGQDIWTLDLTEQAQKEGFDGRLTPDGRVQTFDGDKKAKKA